MLISVSLSSNSPILASPVVLHDIATVLSHPFVCPFHHPLPDSVLPSPFHRSNPPRSFHTPKQASSPPHHFRMTTIPAVRSCNSDCYWSFLTDLVTVDPSIILKPRPKLPVAKGTRPGRVSITWMSVNQLRNYDRYPSTACSLRDLKAGRSCMTNTKKNTKCMPMDIP